MVLLAKAKGIEKYPACRTERKDIMPAGCSHLEGPFDVFLTLDFAEIRRREKLGIFHCDPHLGRAQVRAAR